MSESRVQVMGAPLDALTMAETVGRCEELVRSRRPAQHVVLNAGKYVLMQDDARLARIIRGCAIVNADGMSVVWAARILGVPVPERVTGIDLMGEMLSSAQREGWPVYFLGARPEILARFTEVVLEGYPRIRIAGTADGYFQDDAEVADRVRASGARIVFIAMPSPRKEYFADEQLERMGEALIIGVGGSFDVWAGATQRAPEWMQRSGLEWFYRLSQEPGRMWRRYLVGNSRFVALVAREFFSGATRREADRHEDR